MSEPQSPWGLPTGQPYQPPWTPYAPVRDPHRRPGTVLAAGIVTIVISGLVLLGTGLLSLVLVLARDEIVADIETDLTVGEREMFTGSQLATAVLVLLAVLAVWCVVAIVLAVLALRRSQVARILLVVSAAVAALLSLVTVLFLFVTAVPLIGGVAVAVLLVTGGAGDWYAARD